VRTALPRQLGVGLFQRPELQDAALVLELHVGRVVAGARAQDLDQPVLGAAEIDALAAEDDAVLVLRQGGAEEQIGLAAAGRAAVEEPVGLAEVGLHLAAGIGDPDRALGPAARQLGQLGALLGIEPGEDDVELGENVAQRMNSVMVTMPLDPSPPGCPAAPFQLTPPAPPPPRPSPSSPTMLHADWLRRPNP